MTYRFAQASFWGALALADVDALDWSVVRGLSLRHLRWWSERPISDRDGVVSVGYGYDNRLLGESYNAAGSPYWCLKAFAMLAAPDDHPFWTVDEAAAPTTGTTTCAPAGMVLGRDRSQVVALVAQSDGWSFVEQANAKYFKLAYSSRFGFNGDFEERFDTPVTDSMLAVTDLDTGAYGVRNAVTRAEVDNGVALARWSPLPGVVIDTALTGGAPWHVRLHRVTTERELLLAESGFALPWDADAPDPSGASTGGDGWVSATSPWGASTIRDIVQTTEPRAAETHAAKPNANMMHPHALVPTLEVTVEPGTHWIACAVGASDDAAAVAVDRAPQLEPALRARLEAFIVAADGGAP